MTQQEIQERGSQIALMRGYEVSKNKECFKIPNENRWISLEELHSDWNWLISAVDFIEKQKIVVYINFNNCVIQSIGNRENNFKPTTYQDVYGSDKKEAVFIAVSDFAKKFNNKKL
jgi:hypothetical protein